MLYRYTQCVPVQNAITDRRRRNNVIEFLWVINQSYGGETGATMKRGGEELQQPSKIARANFPHSSTFQKGPRAAPWLKGKTSSFLKNSHSWLENRTQSDFVEGGHYAFLVNFFTFISYRQKGIFLMYGTSRHEIKAPCDLWKETGFLSEVHQFFKERTSERSR